MALVKLSDFAMARSGDKGDGSPGSRERAKERMAWLNAGHIADMWKTGSPPTMTAEGVVCGLRNKPARSSSTLRVRFTALAMEPGTRVRGARSSARGNRLVLGPSWPRPTRPRRKRRNLPRLGAQRSPRRRRRLSTRSRSTTT